MMAVWTFNREQLDRALADYRKSLVDDRYVSAVLAEEVARDVVRFLTSPQAAKLRVEGAKIGTTKLDPAQPWPFPPHKPKPERE
mgnify:CR=1 FL=1